MSSLSLSERSPLLPIQVTPYTMYTSTKFSNLGIYMTAKNKLRSSGGANSHPQYLFSDAIVQGTNKVAVHVKILDVAWA